MKYWAYYILFFIYIREVNAQIQLKITEPEPQITKDSIRFTVTLPVIKPAPCLEKLLWAIAKSNKKYYRSGESFYVLNFSHRRDYKYLEIYMAARHDAKKTNYSAAIILKSSLFLCDVNVSNEPLFLKTSLSETKLKLSIIKKSTPIISLIEPSLQGTMSICEGFPIYVEVYTPEPISGYKMNIKR
ncbi:hypothetical protein [Mucilaginibacter kameinonensis]|uniref:hypothetical protein n=1 Tax=Mucilaginibacter kameinonensis TaxID=452286 RepID=UPI000EF791CD|nr:hypothetical protein [Mucilaginibacter kameinonensis]